MTRNISRIISELEEIEIAIRDVIHAYHRGDERVEGLEKTLDRINTIAILYGDVVKMLDGIEQQSLKEMRLRKLLIPLDFEGVWYVTRSHPQTGDTETDRSGVPIHLESRLGV